MRICVIGEGMIELRGGPDAWRLGYGGDTLNTAIHLARLGRHVQYFTALGADRFSAEMRQAWAEEGLDLSLTLTDPDRQAGLYAITTDVKGERSFLYWRNESAATGMFALPASKQALDVASAADVIVFSLISMAILPQSAREALIDLCSSVRARGGCIVFDGNYRPRLWGDRAQARCWRDAAISVCNFGLPTLSDEALLEDNQELSASDVARRWAGPDREVIVKLGSSGCFLPGGEISPPQMSVEVLDTSGAGDAFNAGYLHARLNGAPPPTAALFGHRLAGWVIARPGAIPPRDATAPYALPDGEFGPRA